CQVLLFVDIHGTIIAARSTADDSEGESLSKRVLIVEDEQDVAELVADVLDLEGFEARLALGESALEVALSFQPDVVLLDLMMPVVDGFEVARRMRANSSTEKIPIV